MLAVLAAHPEMLQAHAETLSDLDFGGRPAEGGSAAAATVVPPTTSVTAGGTVDPCHAPNTRTSMVSSEEGTHSTRAISNDWGWRSGFTDASMRPRADATS